MPTSSERISEAPDQTGNLLVYNGLAFLDCSLLFYWLVCGWELLLCVKELKETQGIIQERTTGVLSFCIHFANYICSLFMSFILFCSALLCSVLFCSVLFCPSFLPCFRPSVNSVFLSLLMCFLSLCWEPNSAFSITASLFQRRSASYFQGSV